VSLHGNPILQTTKLPDGRPVRIRVGIAEDSYVADKDMTTVTLEVRVGSGVAAVTDTVLDPSQVEEANHLATRVAEGLHSGELEPTAHAIEPFADSIF
jgi:hypothetical protein